MKMIFAFDLLFYIIHIYLAQVNEDISPQNNLRILKPTPLLNSKTKNAENLKLHSKLLQTLYSDSFSNNYYYTTLYIGPNKKKQTYIIDTTSKIMSSPCDECKTCGKKKTNYYDKSNKKDVKPLKCSSKICKTLFSSDCSFIKKDKNDIFQKTCSFQTKKQNGEGVDGYYLSNIVYFEEDKNKTTNKKIYRSYAIPIGCTIAEHGNFKSYKEDGIMGLNYAKGSFIDVLYNLKVIDRNLFSLCLGLDGGYMSLGEIDSTYHKSKVIKYVPLLNHSNIYSFNVFGISVGSNKIEKLKLSAKIDSSSSFTYFPKDLFKIVYNQFIAKCTNKKGKSECGNIQYDSQLGYCASFSNKSSLNKVINGFWPTITFTLQNNTSFSWTPINYHYYYIQNEVRKACLGIKNYSGDSIIFGNNFMHGHDVIFDRTSQKLGFVPADCSNMASVDKKVILQQNTNANANTKTNVKNKENKDNKDNKDDVEFIQGHSTELKETHDFKMVNVIILLSSLIIIIIVIVIIVSSMMMNMKDVSSYENISDEPNDNKIAPKIEDITQNNGTVTSEEVQYLRKMMRLSNLK